MEGVPQEQIHIVVGDEQNIHMKEEEPVSQVVQIIPQDTVVTLASREAGGNIILTEGELVGDGSIEVYNTVNAQQIETYQERIKYLEEQLAAFTQNEQALNERLKDHELVVDQVVTLKQKLLIMEGIVMDFLSGSPALTKSLISKLNSVGIFRAIRHKTIPKTTETEIKGTVTSDTIAEASQTETTELPSQADVGTTAPTVLGTTMESAPSAFICKICGLSCKGQAALTRHTNARHPGNHSADESGEKSESASKVSSVPETVTKSGRRIKKRKLYDFEDHSFTDEDQDQPENGDTSPMKSKSSQKKVATDKQKMLWVVYRDGKFQLPAAEQEAGRSRDGAEQPPDAAAVYNAGGDGVASNVTQHSTAMGGQSLGMKFKCKMCEDIVFDDILDLHDHIRNLHVNNEEPQTYDKGQLLTCGICGVTKKNSKALESHLLDHQVAEKRKAIVKDKPVKRVYTKRAKGKKRDRTTCEICGKDYLTKGFQKHMDTHNNPVLCDLCGKGFPSQDSLSNHKLRDHEDMSQAKYKCDTCGMVFTTFYKCKAHLAVHKVERDVTCEYCQKTFPCKRYLWTHLRVKHLEKNFACQLCDKKFGLKTQLKIHVDSAHMKVRKYRCRKCNLDFAEHSALSDHRNKNHAGEITYQCLLCEKGFQRRYRYRSHLQQAHGVESSVQDDGQLVIHGQENLIQRLDMENIAITEVPSAVINNPNVAE